MLQRTRETWLDELTAAGDDPSVRALVLTGAGSDQVDHALKLLEGSFSRLCEAAGVDPDELAGPVARLLAAMDGGPR